MANPGRVRRQLIGVADPRFAERMLASLRAHGSTDAWVVHGGGLDELTTTGPSTVLALRHDDGADTFTVDPVALGLAPATHEQLVGGDPAHNADVVRRVLDGEHGAHRDIVVLNAAAALVVAGVAGDLQEAGGDRRAVDRRRQGGGGTRGAWSGCPRTPRPRDRPGPRVDGQPRAGVRRPRHGPVAVRREIGRRRRPAPPRRTSSTSATRQTSPSAAAAARASCGCARRSPSVAASGSAGRCGSAVSSPPWSSGPPIPTTWPPPGRRCSRRPSSSKATPTTSPPRCTAASWRPPPAGSCASRSAMSAAVVCGSRRTSTSTARVARRARPATVSFADAVFNVGRTALLVAALAAGDVDALRRGHRRPAAPGRPLRRLPARRTPPWPTVWRPARGADGCRAAGRRSPCCATRRGPASIAAALPDDGHTKRLRIAPTGASVRPSAGGR